MLRRAEIFVAIVAVIGVAIVLAGSDEANAAEPGGAATATDGAVTTTAAAEPPPSRAGRAVGQSGHRSPASAPPRSTARG